MKPTPRRLCGIFCWIVSFAMIAPALAAEGGYHLIKKIPIAGDGGWDYVAADSEGRRLFVSHDTELIVLDLDSGAVIGKIKGGEDTHGAAVAREYGRGFISASDPGSVTIFDLKTLAVIGKVRVGDDPNGIIYDPKTKRVFTADRGSKRLTAIDAKTGKIVATSENLGGRTEHLASDEAGHIFLNMQNLNTLLKFDAQTLKLLATYPTAPCGMPSSMDMDRVHERVFIGCRSGAMAVVDANTGKVITTLPMGKGVDGCEFDPATGLIYCSTGADGALNVFHEDTPDKYSHVESVKTQIGARTMALDRKTGNVYLAVADFGPRPVATPENPSPRPPILPGTFTVLVMGH
jgi:DNA-binding beta-propeller fold protein YncE